ncbi:c-type cytochrome biogenesis protein CcsB [Nocardioides sp. GY 10127]|uniref:c-type cytochrome biogenesis protein CcsB n=1 Tax=Nocardioides sp. GY 10127 TaxID=2569762 RepID=UPI0010A836C7|nr:c-type cytochrome biogenesis protein CcsB [Nocardioides sp. GY 10127]TIC80110.1 c-type cytochrome biogenesis protein CcsB [Nocardioides sp. GY 10127]
MSQTAWEGLSNQAIAAAGIVYFLALLAHLAEWALLRTVAQSEVKAEQPVAVGATSSSSSASSASASADSADAPALSAEDVERQEDRVTMAGTFGVLLTCIAVAVHLVGLVARGMAAEPHRVPWGNMYEFTLTGTFVVALIYLLVRRKFGLDWMAPVVLTVVLAILMVAVLWLYAPVEPLMESLHSYWLVIHVVSAVIATGAFTVGGITSVFYLIQSRRERKRAEAVAAGEEVGPDRGWWARVPGTERLDLVSYRLHAFAFPVWTFAVLITGPIWAHEAWSRYWNWDPKEVWAFITWVVYAAYLHARATAGWRGRSAAILALVGMGTLWFNFIGINYFSTTSQHSYADAPTGSPVVATAGVSPGD